MTTDDKQAAVPFSPQEGLPELEEQVLEEITGAGISNFLKGCVACGAPKPPTPVRESSPPPTSFGPILAPGGGFAQTSRPDTDKFAEGSGPGLYTATKSKMYAHDVFKKATLSPIRTK